MPWFGFRRSTIGDASVNLVPFAMLLVFLGLTVVIGPTAIGSESIVISVGLLVIPAVVLLLATAVVARSIQGDESGG